MVENQHNVSQMEQIVAKSASLWLTKAAKHFFVRMMATKQCRRSSSISGLFALSRDESRAITFTPRAGLARWGLCI
jgi:hypothetical protein